MRAFPKYVLQSLTFLTLGLATLVSRDGLSAQNPPMQPMAPPPEEEPLVYVTPDNLTSAQRLGGTSGHVETFWVYNIGTVYDTYAISCVGTSGVTCTGTSVANLSLAPSSFATVQAYYNVGALGTGRLTLKAIGQASDSGWYNVPIAAPPDVTPDAVSVVKLASSGVVQRFTVKNLGTVNATYNLTSTCSGTATGCTGPSSITLAGGAVAPVNVSFSVGAFGGTGSVKLKAVQSTLATVKDSGWVNVTAGGSMQYPTLDVSSVNAGTMIERDLCLTVVTGRSAAYECGDLRITHPLPTTRTLNKARTPTLLYNSQQAHPYPLVAVNIGLSVGAANPDSVVSRLLWGPPTQVQTDRQVHAGSEWTTGRASRVALRVDSVSTDTAMISTGAHNYTLEVTFWYGATPRTSTGAGQTVVVNRSKSYFGAGWWLGGLERLSFPNDTLKLWWQGGDGSFREYTRVAGTSIWRAPNVDRRDSLTRSGSPGNYNYWRYLPHGVKVQFDVYGRHVATINRLGHQTVFGWSASPTDTLKTITLPPTGSGKTYTFAYAAGRLQSVTSPPIGVVTRITNLTVGGGRVTAIQDPGVAAVGFGYVVGDTNRIISRTDRRGYITRFFYDATKRLVKDSLSLTATSAAVLTFRPAESQGILVPVDTALAYTKLDGSRTDVVDTTGFWLDRFGAPRRIRNALGEETILTRGDTLWPALVTKVRSANGRVVTANYDARGNTTTSADSSTSVWMGPDPMIQVFATTRYTWDPRWDFVTTIVRPMHDSTVIAYDTLNGNRLWQQDARGQTSRISFYYYSSGVASGLLRAVQTPSGARDSIAYGTIGNLASTKTPLGNWTHLLTDGVGRDTLRLTPGESVQVEEHRTYNLRDEVVSTTVIGPATTYPQATLQTTSVYDPEGNLTSLSRWTSPDPNAIGTSVTAWRYDGANRPVAEIAPGGGIDSSVFDAAGNPIQLVSRRGHNTYSEFDAMNRVIKRVIPAVTYTDTSALGWNFPLYPTCSNMICISGDTATYAYDAVGNMIQANNRDAKVWRTYNLNGTMATDSSRIRTVAEITALGSWDKHVYGLRFDYDLNGRRVALRFPAQLAPQLPGDPNRPDSITYQYDALSGQLTRIRDMFGDDFRFAYDSETRIDTLYYPLGDYRSQDHDADGRVFRIRYDRIATGGVSHQWDLVYNAQGRAVLIDPQVANNPDVVNTYTSLGFLGSSSRAAGNGIKLERWSGDALANVKSYVDSTPVTIGMQVHDQRTITSEGNMFQAGTGRVTAFGRYSLTEQPYCQVDGYTCIRVEADGNGQNVYDASGNIRLTTMTQQRTMYWDDSGPGGWYPVNQSTQKRVLASYFASDQTLRVADKRSSDTYSPTNPLYGWPAFEEYRYDALGRRVLRRLRDGQACAVPVKCQRQRIQRFIWDAHQIVAEIQYPGGDGVSSTDLERDTVTIQNDSSKYWGRVLYVNGPDLDQPVAVVRIGYGILTASGAFESWGPLVIAPEWNWHGAMSWVSFYGPTPRTKPNGATVSVVIPEVQRAYGGRPTTEDNNGLFGSVLLGHQDATGQIYKRARYYDPESGRFTQEDPIGLAGGLNVYGFADGDPISFGDPFGLCPAWCLLVKIWLGEIPLGNKRSQQTISKLVPAVQTAAQKMINRAALQGRELLVYHGSRSFAEQNALYGQGRTAAQLEQVGLNPALAQPKAQRVTDAVGGKSYHNFDLAIDAVELRNGNALWNGDFQWLGLLGESVGFEWGGRWEGTLRDRVHFQMSMGMSTDEWRFLIFTLPRIF